MEIARDVRSYGILRPRISLRPRGYVLHTIQVPLANPVLRELEGEVSPREHFSLDLRESSAPVLVIRGVLACFNRSTLDFRSPRRLDFRFRLIKTRKQL